MKQKTYAVNIYKHDQELEITTLEGNQNYFYAIPKAFQKDIEHLNGLIINEDLATTFYGEPLDNELNELDIDTLSKEEVLQDLKYYCK